MCKVEERSQPQCTAMDVVSDVLSNIILENQLFLAPKQGLLKRTANKHRAIGIPQEPVDLDFEIWIIVLWFNLQYITVQYVLNVKCYENKRILKINFF